jgi:hypothetical protein
MGFMDFLLGGTPEVTLPPAIKAAVEQLKLVPFGPERDALEAQIAQTLGLSQGQFNTALSGLGGVLDTSEGTYQSALDNLAGIGGSMQRFAGSDPYMEFYGNPAAREQAYLAALQEANRAAFDPYGSVGAESEMRKGLLSANMASRGITNSGIARRQEEQERMRMAAARQEADAKALQQVREQGIQEAGAYQAAKGLASQNLGQAGNIQNMRASIGQYAPQQRMDAAKLYGNTMMDTAGILGAAQSEKRNAAQAVESYNTEVKNKVNQDWANAQNQMNVQQGSLDASRRRPGLLDILGPIASLGMQAAGSFAGGAGGAAGALGNAASSWNPGNFSSPYAQDWSSYGGGSGGYF